MFSTFHVYTGARAMDGCKLRGRGQGRVAKTSKCVSRGSPLQKRGRTRSGCFCCRKRKIKCDGPKKEDKSCGNCSRALYLCVWPKGNESLPHKSAFQLTKLNEVAPAQTWMFVDSRPQKDVTISTKEPTGEPLREEYQGLDTLGEIGQLGFESPMLELSGSDLQETLHTSLSDDLLEELYYLKGASVSPAPSDDYESLEDDGKTIVTHNRTSASQAAVSDVTAVKKEGDLIIVRKTVGITGNNKFEKELQDDALFRVYLTDLGSSVRLSEMNLSSTDTLLFEAFTRGFITAISPQIAHIKLQPGSVFIPPGIHNDVLQTMFLGCGASFLALNNGSKEMGLISTKKTNESIHQLVEFLSNNGLSENCDWLMILLLLFYLKQKFVYESRETITLNIITAAEIIKLWVLIKERHGDHIWQARLKQEQKKIVLTESSSFLDLITIFSNIVSSMRNIESATEYIDIPPSAPMKRRRSSTLDLDSSNLAIELTKEKKQTLNLLPYQRTIMESFVFNYTTSLFNFDRSYLHLLTSPYEIFESLREYLSSPIFDCAVPWMNHPVAGATIPILELQAKVCWHALKVPLSDSSIKEINNILHLAKYFTPPILPPQVYQKEHESVQRKLMESCYGGVILSNAVTLYSMKLLDRNLSVRDDTVQAIVQCALDYVEKLSIHCQGASILVWAFTVVGSCVINPEQQDYLSWRMSNFADVLKVRGFESSLAIQKLAWQGPAWDILFEDSVIRHYTL